MCAYICTSLCCVFSVFSVFQVNWCTCYFCNFLWFSSTFFQNLEFVGEVSANLCLFLGQKMMRLYLLVFPVILLSRIWSVPVVLFKSGPGKLFKSLVGWIEIKLVYCLQRTGDNFDKVIWVFILLCLIVIWFPQHACFLLYGDLGGGVATARFLLTKPTPVVLS